MFTVALVGADGAGKTTMARRLEGGRPLRAKYIYMGINPEASTHALPTTRLVQAAKRALGRSTHQGGPPDPARQQARKGLLGRLKSNLRMANLLAEEGFRQSVAWWYRRRGFIVLCDRHFYCDHYAHEVAGPAPGTSWLRRLHGVLLRRVYPQPDLMIVLDAPPEVLFARKGEGTPALLERRRREYLELAERDPRVAVINAARPFDEVERDVVARIIAYGETRKDGAR